MKKIEAMIKPSTLEIVVEALMRLGVSGVTLTGVKGCGQQRGHCELYNGPHYVVDLLAKVKLEVVAADEQVEEIVGMLRAGACSDRIGDGKIFVLPLEEVVRVRTGERGKKAL